MQELIRLDDGVEMMTEDDRKDLQKEPQRRNDSHSLTKDFSGALHERRQRLASSSGSAAKRGASSRSSGPGRLPDGVIGQSVAKRFAPPPPPGGYIWRGGRVACVLTLRHVWDGWCLANGRSRSEVPIPNLFDDEGHNGGASSSSVPRAP